MSDLYRKNYHRLSQFFFSPLPQTSQTSIVLIFLFYNGLSKLHFEEFSMLFFLACSLTQDPESIDPPEPPRRQEIKEIDVCIFLEQPSSIDRFYFLYKVNRHGVDASAELTTTDDPLVRCSAVRLALPPNEDGIRIVFDWMPRGEPVESHELRVYQRTPHLPDDPYAVARYDHAPFQDFIFFVNLVTPTLHDAETIYLP